MKIKQCIIFTIIIVIGLISLINCTLESGAEGPVLSETSLHDGITDTLGSSIWFHHWSELNKSYWWASGWTITKPFSVGNNSYYFFLRESSFTSENKAIHIYSMNSNGTIGSKVSDSTRGIGWTHAEFAYCGSKTYLMLHGKVQLNGKRLLEIFEMNNDGSLGDLTYAKELIDGWDTFKFYNISGTTYMLMLRSAGYNSDDKNAYIWKLKSNGTLEWVKSYRWSQGWTLARFFTRRGKNYMFLYKKNGAPSGQYSVHVDKINSDGTIGDRAHNMNFKEGWEHINFCLYEDLRTPAEVLTGMKPIELMHMHLLGEPASGGNEKIYSITDDAYLGTKLFEAYGRDLYTTVEFYRNVRYPDRLFELKSNHYTGNIVIYQWYVERVSQSSAGSPTVAGDPSPPSNGPDLTGTFYYDDGYCQFILKNTGNRDVTTNNFIIRHEFSDSGTPDADMDMRNFLPSSGLAAGASKVFPKQSYGSNPAAVSCDVFILDYGNKIAESSETNNRVYAVNHKL
ncbi:MAG: hypothetical protein JXB00_00670 [Bacteroidales bacterium]|nr:hypothetical protein [Bacteroidales bacterium]